MYLTLKKKKASFTRYPKIYFLSLLKLIEYPLCIKHQRPPIYQQTSWRYISTNLLMLFYLLQRLPHKFRECNTSLQVINTLKIWNPQQLLHFLQHVRDRPRSSAISFGGFRYDHAHWIELSTKFRGVWSRDSGVVFCLVFLCLQRMQRVFTKRVSFLELSTLNCSLSFLNHLFWALFSPVSRSAPPVDRDRNRSLYRFSFKLWPGKLF